MRKRITASAISMVLLAANLCLAGYAPQQGQPKSETSPEQRGAAASESRSGVVQQTTALPMSAEEKLIRNAYVKLMRYHSAALDEAAARTGRENRPEDYVTFEIRNLPTGPIEYLAGKDLGELVTGSGGEVLKVTGHHLRYKHGPKHAYYDVEWVRQKAELGSQATSGDIERSRGNEAMLEEYTSYEVTVRLGGKERSYKAFALFGGVAGNATVPARGRIIDNVTQNINRVMREDSPRLRSPWPKYITTGLYKAVARTIRETREAGEPLIPADSPVGYLPGDDVLSDSRDKQTYAATATCPPALTISGPDTCWWFGGEKPDGYKIKITLSATPSTYGSYQWQIISGSSIARFSNGLDSLTSTTSEAVVKSISKSLQELDVAIQVTAGGVTSDRFRLTVRSPHKLTPGDVEHDIDPVYAYLSLMRYTVSDQFDTELPSDVPVNEQWSTTVVTDYPGCNWRRGDATSYVALGAAFADRIQGEGTVVIDPWIPQPQPPPPPPPPGEPQLPLSTIKTQHWGQEWFVGSTTIGSGRRVQTNVLQKYVDHGTHETITSPVP